jgi:putative MATE family efflux protein
MEKNKLGVMPVGKLIVSMSIPMMLSFFIQALYNVVDSMFVAKISEDALAAVSLAFPLQNILTAISVGTGVGLNAMVPRFLGMKDRERANRVANNALFMAIMFWFVFIVIGFTLVPLYYKMQTGVEEIVSKGVEYLTIVCVASLGCFVGQVCEKMFVATGRSTLAMASQATGAVINIIFDPLLIFGIGPFPQMGIKGAAVATVMGQILAACLSFTLNCKLNQDLDFSLSKMRPKKEVIKAIYAVGIPSMLVVGLSSVMSFGLNQILLAYSTTATALFGIWLKLQNFGFMPLFGMNNGTVPILSYNYGAKNMDRVRQAVRLAFIYAMVVMIAVLCITELLPVPIMQLFNASDYMLGIGQTALRICCISFPLGGICIVLTSACQALDHALYSLIVNLCRQLVIILPAAWAISALTGNLDMIWWCFPIAEGGSAIVTVVLFGRMAKHIHLNE